MPAKGQRVEAEYRFWAKVKFDHGDGCWEWQAGRDGGGYGFFMTSPGKHARAHRMAWELVNGRKVPAGMQVCHRCDNRRCVRAELDPASSHLFIGTAKDNIQDASKKGRLSYSPERKAKRTGEGNPNAVLTWDAARGIRAMRAAGATYSQIRRRYGVGMGTVSAVLKGITWKETTTMPPSAA